MSRSAFTYIVDSSGSLLLLLIMSARQWIPRSACTFVVDCSGSLLLGSLIYGILKMRNECPVIGCLDQPAHLWMIAQGLGCWNL